MLLCQCGTLDRADQRNAGIAEQCSAQQGQRRKALRTSGASNGQTIAGALGTGVHGSAIGCRGHGKPSCRYPTCLTANRNMWIERASAPVMNDGFAARLGAELVRDDTLFEAALVSLGSLGIVHSVLICATGRYRAKHVAAAHPLWADKGSPEFARLPWIWHSGRKPPSLFFPSHHGPR